MNRRASLILIVSSFVAILLVVKLSPIFGKPLTEKYLRYNDVRGAAIEINGTIHTLNFKQQNALIAKINEAQPLQNNPPGKSAAKVLVYRFNAPELNCEVDASSKNLIFFEPEWNSRYLTTSYDLSIFNE